MLKSSKSFRQKIKEKSQKENPIKNNVDDHYFDPVDPIDVEPDVESQGNYAENEKDIGPDLDEIDEDAHPSNAPKASELPRE